MYSITTTSIIVLKVNTTIINIIEKVTPKYMFTCFKSITLWWQNELFDDLTSHPQNVVDYLFHWIPENTSSFEKCQHKGWWVHKLLIVRVWKSIFVKRCMLPIKIQYFPYISYVVLNTRTEIEQVFVILKDIKVVSNWRKTLSDLKNFRNEWCVVLNAKTENIQQYL